MGARLPSIFIGCSSETLDVAVAVQAQIEQQLGEEAYATKWTDVDAPSGMSILEWLVKQIYDYDFAVMILASDDITRSREETFAVARDNVIFELGLFMGRLGRERTFILEERGANLRLPSDLGNVITLRYVRRSDNNLQASLSVPGGRIVQQIRLLGPFRNSSSDHSEATLVDKVAILRLELRSESFHPDLIIGISRGGLSVAALLSKQIGGTPRIPTMSLSAYPGFNNAFNHIAFNRDTFERKAGRIQILIVDDVCREGKTLYDAKSYVESSIKFTDVEITTAALTAYNTQSEPLYRPRFVVENTDEPVERFGGDLEPFRR